MLFFSCCFYRKSLIIFFTSCITTIIASCVALFNFLFATEQHTSVFHSIRFLIQFISASPSFSLSEREGAALHYKSKLHIYHISIISLLIIFGITDYYQHFRKARAVRWWPSLYGRSGRVSASALFICCNSSSTFFLNCTESTFGFSLFPPITCPAKRTSIVLYLSNPVLLNTCL
jgi:hypothetical protein